MESDLKFFRITVLFVSDSEYEKSTFMSDSSLFIGFTSDQIEEMISEP